MRTGLKIFSLALLLTVGSFCTAPRARAMDPVTLAILAPIALKAANAAKPYLIRAGLNTGRCLLKMGEDTLQTLRLPLGLLQMSIGAPFGGFRNGLVNTIKGFIGPGKLIVHTLLLPAMMIGFDFNI